MTKSSMPDSVFIDTGFFKALVDEDDDFYRKAVKTWQKFRKKETVLITSNFIIDETLTVIRVKCRLEKALKFRDLLAESGDVIKIVRVTVADEAGAWKWFVKDWRRLSFTDCVSMALMERLGVNMVAGFDQHFTRAGFKYAH
ncbi:MAG: PilT-like protein [Candidatus Beckwithbacteria bacterium GW2011_GWB1_47_15]|uniref:PilT-like protein n=1 Tax=Candidatus Beckwithbacteria bacterium GW2011_GWB1_47_15 TaxID=1618371 RepID=A0A0G1UU20_9BACT|nr:MAG: PilT-like protein [Candidatus Beckwithbacteria bacterium GW2011_GWA1_46_30]KKU61205.1 MAG: PilT-like protein [Candidatus Beckwithbacteria bacterium GW2011_GWB1_47_15]KKU72044.1 MAG: PilT-like protein [Candidatus Beckwithbacteria bacterium GW2011_GWA2_47_25]KKW03282.1 MAG: PilT-like protein [Candidatus Beckwithbacteria bacterium GW2011_GWC2_49_11]HAF63994.1 hypothetical protein [Candidatus Beckwithbacteria bacterium]